MVAARDARLAPSHRANTSTSSSSFVAQNERPMAGPKLARTSKQGRRVAVRPSQRHRGAHPLREPPSEPTAQTARIAAEVDGARALPQPKEREQGNDYNHGAHDV